MYDCKIKMPQPFQIVTIEKRDGIIYEKIAGETLGNLINANAEKFEEYLDVFVKLHLDIITHHSKRVLSYKEYLAAMVKSKTKDCEEILDKINVLKDGNSILHGDFHPDNMLIKEDECIRMRYC